MTPWNPSPRTAQATVPRLPYPDGWFALAASHELKAGKVLTRRLMGEDVVLYRTAGGTMRAVRPYCPHLGAHLGHGATVQGDNLRCPFHHFQFGLDGACVKTGYETPPPLKTRLSVLEHREIDGFIFVWRHALGQAPSWEIEPLPPADFPTPYCVVRDLEDHPQEVLENAFDLGHFRPVHGVPVTYLHEPLFDGTRAVVSMTVQRSGVDPRPGAFSLLSPTGRIIAQGLGVIQSEVEIVRLGLHFRFWVFSTPVDPGRLTFTMAASMRLVRHGLAGPANALASAGIAHLFAWDASRDFDIWQNKIPLSHPRLAKGDGPIMQFRRWAQQFYSPQDGVEEPRN